MNTQPIDRGDASEKAAGGAAPSSGRWRVVIVDDSLAIRCGLRLAMSLEPGLEVVGEGADGLEGVNLVRELQPDCVVMDVKMPVMDGIDATLKIKADYPETVVIGYSMYDDLQDRTSFLAAGAAVLVLKSNPISVLIATVRSALGGQKAASAGARV